MCVCTLCSTMSNFKNCKIAQQILQKDDVEKEATNKQTKQNKHHHLPRRRMTSLAFSVQLLLHATQFQGISDCGNLWTFVWCFFFFFHFGIYTFQSQRSLFSRIYFSIFVDILACNSLYCSLAAQCAQVIFSWCCNLRETGLQGDLWRAMAR